MNLYKLSYNWNKEYHDWEGFQFSIVAAENDSEARKILPSKYMVWGGSRRDWADTPEEVTVELLGIADSSFKQGDVIAAGR